MSLARSQYVRDLIAQTPWQDRAQIDDLLTLERIILGETNHAGWVWNAYVRPTLIKRLHAEYTAIRDELDAGWREREHERWQKERGENLQSFLGDIQRGAQEHRGTFEAQLQAWREAGHDLDPPPPYEPAKFEGWSLDEIRTWHEERSLRLPWEPTWQPDSP